MRLSFGRALTLIGRLALALVLCIGAQALSSVTTPANANDDMWKVVESSGQVRSAEGETQWSSVQTGDVLPPGVQIKTGTDGHLKLVRNGDSLDVSPDSLMHVDNAQATGDANIGITLGTVLFKVRTRPEYSFGVKTPYLAAVIKGTTFTVTVDPQQGAALHVIEGAVQVSSLESSHVTIVRPGQTATVPSTPGAAMQVIEGSASFEPGTDGDSGNNAAEVDTDSTGDTNTAADTNAGKEHAAEVVKEANGPTGQAVAAIERTNEAKSGKVTITKTVGQGVGNYLALSNGLVGNADAVGNASFTPPGQDKKSASVADEVVDDGSAKQSNGNAKAGNGGGTVASVSSTSAVSTSNAGGVSSSVSNAGGVSSSVSNAGGVSSSVSSAGGVSSSVSSAGGVSSSVSSAGGVSSSVSSAGGVSSSVSSAGGAAAGVVTSNAGGAAAGIVVSNAGGNSNAVAGGNSNAGGAAAGVVVPDSNAGGAAAGVVIPDSNAGGNGNGNAGGNGKGKGNNS